MPATVTLQTSAIAQVIDDNQNAWEDFAGADINLDVAYQFIDVPPLDDFDQANWIYRGQAAMCTRATDGAIVRVRIGDGSGGDRNVYQQIITDPTDPAQWLAWTLLYSGDHYAIAIEADATAGAGYRVFRALSDGIYVWDTTLGASVLKISKTGIVRIKPTAFDTGRIYFQTAKQDTDSGRALLWWYTPDINVETPEVYEDCANYRWYRHDLVALKIGDDYYRYRSMAHEAAARNRYASESLTVDGPYSATSDADFNQWDNARYLKGPSGRAGFHSLTNLYVTQLPSSPFASAYYLFYNEREQDAMGNTLSNLKHPLFWSRSVDYPYYLSAPTPVGYSIWGFAGVVLFGDYIYLAGNGRVLRRPAGPTKIDLTNYLLEGDYTTPRDNQRGTGTLVCANKDNVVGELLGLTDSDEIGVVERRVILGLGQKGVSDLIYNWKRDSAWWISRLRKTRDDTGVQHVEIEIGDFWHRLEPPFIDTFVLPGRFEWNDWQPNATNQIAPYYSNDTDPFSAYSPTGADPSYLPHLLTIASGEGPIAGLGGASITLFNGWRGENGMVTALLWQDGGIVFRYEDADNFFLVKATSGGSLSLIRYQDGLPSTLATAPMGNVELPFWLTVEYRWKRIYISADWGDASISHTLIAPVIYAGFVGFTSPEISNFNVHEWHASLTTKDMLRLLLAYVDEHDVVLELDETTASAAQINTQWGVQSATDLDTPEKAFRALIEASNLQVVWLED